MVEGGWRRRGGRAAIAAGLAAALIAVAPAGPPARAADGPSGFAHAAARSVAIDPRAGGLSFGVNFGNATADQENTVARGRVKAINMGLVGAAAAADGCDGGAPVWPAEDQPQAIVVDSRDEGAGEWHSEDGGIILHRVRATPQPLAEAYTELEGLSVPGVLEVASATTSSTAGTGEDGLRFARAVATVGELRLGGGLVVLRGMRWEVLHRDEADPASTATFDLGVLEIGGVPVPLGDLAGAVDAANAVLRPLGIELRLPRVRTVDGGVFVDPLGIALVPNELRNGVVSELFALLHPLRRAAIDALLELDPCNDAYVLILDLLVNSLTGAGTFEVNLGGVEASSRPPATPVAIGGPPATATATAGPAAPDAPRPGGPGALAGADRPASPVSPPAAITTGAPGGAGGRAAASAELPTARPASEVVRRDWAAAVAGITLLLGAGLVEADRRRIRRAAGAA